MGVLSTARRRALPSGLAATCASACPPPHPTVPTTAGEAPPPGPGSRPSRRFAPVPAYRCTTEGLQAAHAAAGLPFERDGVYLLHREAHYAAGSSPLALVWKDASCSKYVIDTDAQGGLWRAGGARQEVAFDWGFPSAHALGHGAIPAALCAGPA